MDMWMHGDLKYRGQGCGSAIVPQAMGFYDNTDLSQVVVSSSAASCWLNQYARSDVGKLNLDEKRWNDLFMVKDFKLDSTSVGEHIHLF